MVSNILFFFFSVKENKTKPFLDLSFPSSYSSNCLHFLSFHSLFSQFSSGVLRYHTHEGPLIEITYVSLIKS